MLGAACKTMSRFLACLSKAWKRRIRWSLNSFSVSRQSNDLIICDNDITRYVICQPAFTCAGITDGESPATVPLSSCPASGQMIPVALCLEESHIECRGFDSADQMKRYVRWWQEGYLSSTGKFFDIGNTIGAALSTFIETGNPFSGPTDSHSAGNGSLMRLVPVPLFFAGDLRKAIEKSGESSRTTYGARIAIDACRYFAALILGAINGEDKEILLSDHYTPDPSYWQEHPLVPEIAELAAGSFKQKSPPDIKRTGYVVPSLEVALWALHHGESFEEGCLMAVNLGDDADTTGAIYGQLAGVFYGERGIPLLWRDQIVIKTLSLKKRGD